MADEKTTLDTRTEDPIAEPVYVMAPHPETHVVSNERTETPEEPVVAEVSLPDMIQQAVEGMRDELRVELQAELQSELLKQPKEAELNVKG